MKKRYTNDFPNNVSTHPNQSDTEHIVKKDSDTLEYVKSLSDDIFKAKKGERIKTVLTIGKDCIGKTFHAQKFTSEWARHKTSITNRFFKFISWKEQDAEIVFHLTSAQLSKSKKISLVGLLNDVFTETQQFVISDFEKYKLIIVLDGLDGLPLDFDDNVEPLRDVRWPLLVGCFQISSWGICFRLLISGYSPGLWKPRKSPLNSSTNRQKYEVSN